MFLIGDKRRFIDTTIVRWVLVCEMVGLPNLSHFVLNLFYLTFFLSNYEISDEFYSKKIIFLPNFYFKFVKKQTD